MILWKRCLSTQYPLSTKYVTKIGSGFGGNTYRSVSFSRTTIIALPYKKKRNYKMSQEEKEYNKIYSKKRIVVEHTICKLKKYKIMNDIFRNKLRKYDRILDIVTGLVNYRIMNQQCL
jgi:hypothetical protein